MARKYNLGSKSDMRRFERELKKSVMDQAKTCAELIKLLVRIVVII